MLESGKNQFILKKSYEIAYALWRVASRMQEKQFAEKLFGTAMDLIGLGAVENAEDHIFDKILGLEYILRFGVDINMIGVKTGELLLEEVQSLKAAIIGTNVIDKGIVAKEVEEVELSDIFYKAANDNKESGKIETKEKIENLEIENEAAKNGIWINGFAKAEKRQAAILERIRQFGNCRLGDIQIVLPEISERTIRYDLELLVQKGLIERMGTGGRSVYYRAQQEGQRQEPEQRPEKENESNFLGGQTL